MIFGLFGKKRESEPKQVAQSAITLSRADFRYEVGANRFEHLFYTFEIGLSMWPKNRIQDCKTGIERITGLLDSVYSGERGFLKGATGNVSSGERKAEINYYTEEKGLYFGDRASVHLNFQFGGDSLNRAFANLFLYGSQEGLLFAHDTILQLDKMQISPAAKSTFEQIDKIRKGSGPSVENFLLN